MEHGIITGWNAAPGAPANWNPTRDGECGALPIRVSVHEDQSVAYCESAWLPSPSDIAAIVAGSPIILRVVGWQPPVALFVEQPVKLETRPLNLVDRFWNLDGSQRREISLELGLITTDEISLPEMERYRLALSRANGMGVLDRLTAAVEQAEQECKQ
jgi:hypothetical protein